MILKIIALLIVVYLSLCISFYVRTMMRKPEWGTEFSGAMSKFWFKALVFFYYPIGYIRSCVMDICNALRS